MIDITIVVAYLILLLTVGIIKRRHGSGFKTLSKITQKIRSNKLILVATIFASAIGGGTTFGISEKAFSENIAYTYGLVLAIPIDILIAIFVVPKLVQHYKTESIGDIMYNYYGNIGRYVGGMATIAVSVGILAAQISVSGRIFEYILKTNYVWSVILSYSVVVLYTTVGGLQSILFTNLLQFFAIIFAIPVISLIGVYQLGVVEFFSSIPADKFSFNDNPQLIKSTISAALGFAVINLLPTFIQRATLAENVQKTASAIYIKSVIYFFFLIFVTLNGLIAYVKYPDINSNIALPYLIGDIMPIGVQGLVVVGLLAAVMSTADSDLNVTSIAIVKDFFKPLFKIEQSTMMLKIARFTNIIIGSFAIAIALCFSKVVDLVMFIAGFWGPIILVPLLFALFGVTISRIGFLISSICGVAAFLIWSFLFQTDIGLKAVFIGTMANLIIFTSFYISVRSSNR